MAKPAVEPDRRSGARLPTNRSGKVLCGAFAWDCVIRDLSSQGVKVQMLASAAPPAQAQLVDLVAGQAHEVLIAWQKEREVGMKIVRTYDLRGLAPASVSTAKRIWQAYRVEAPTG